MLDLWRGRLSPRKVLALVEHLPRYSAYSEAVAQDDELAENSVEGPAPASLPLTEWTPEAEALWTVADRLADVIRAVVETQGGKVGKIPSAPRPVTAFDRARARRRDEAYGHLKEQLFPGNADEEA